MVSFTSSDLNQFLYEKVEKCLFTFFGATSGCFRSIQVASSWHFHVSVALSLPRMSGKKFKFRKTTTNTLKILKTCENYSVVKESKTRSLLHVLNLNSIFKCELSVEFLKLFLDVSFWRISKWTADRETKLNHYWELKNN